MANQALETVGQARYLRLTTFRRDGTAVQTPVWTVRDGHHLLVITGAATGKAKRLRHTRRVLVAPSDARGRVKPGVQDVEGTAELITDEAELARLVKLLKGRYGFMYTVATTAMRLRGMPMGEGAEIRISLAS
jgi:PPOX class probable F420-dependent enzyme